jgi:hypothetical protein
MRLAALTIGLFATVAVRTPTEIRPNARSVLMIASGAIRTMCGSDVVPPYGQITDRPPGIVKIQVPHGPQAPVARVNAEVQQRTQLRFHGHDPFITAQHFLLEW